MHCGTELILDASKSAGLCVACAQRDLEMGPTSANDQRRVTRELTYTGSTHWLSRTLRLSLPDGDHDVGSGRLNVRTVTDTRVEEGESTLIAIAVGGVGVSCEKCRFLLLEKGTMAIRWRCDLYGVQLISDRSNNYCYPTGKRDLRCRVAAFVAAGAAGSKTPAQEPPEEVANRASAEPNPAAR